MMKRSLTIAIAALAATAASAAVTVTFRGGSYDVISLDADKNTGLNKIFVAYDTKQLTEMRIEGLTDGAEISRYSNLGGGFAETIDFRWEGNTAVLDKPEGDMGYIIEGDDRPYYLWLVNYRPRQLNVSSLRGDDQQDCEMTRIVTVGSGEPIHYYSIDGRQCELSRDIEVDFDNLVWSEESEEYQQETQTKTITYLMNPIVLPTFFCNTTVTLTGDRFLEHWGMGQTVKSTLVYANGVDAHTSAEQTNLPAEPSGDESEEQPDASNMLKTDTSGLGGSAPADISFKAWTTDAVVHNEWQISLDSEFNEIESRFNEQNLDYTFLDEGTYYIRFVGSNNNGTCETVGETYTVSIGASELLIPNAFTPNGDGINDKWKVAYRSLTSFKCAIFDRYGSQLFQFSDPNEGWDGKYKGKYVQPGVYYYVIEAEGADGKKYRKGGDINIVKSKHNTSSAAAE